MSARMTEAGHTKKILLTLLRTPLLRSILILCLSISILLPTYSTIYIMPQFVEHLMHIVEGDARQTAHHLATQMPQASERLTRESITPAFIGVLQKAMADFEIADIKIFSYRGEVIFATKSQDLGKINTCSYFWDTVAKGKIYSKVNEKAGKSLEGEALTRDVAEVYIPLMAAGSFRGAFEIYYDLTERKKPLDLLLRRSTLILYAIATLVFALSGLALFKASSAIMQRNETERQLQETNQFLEVRVAEQTREILMTQKISIEALASLAEYYDIHTGEHLSRMQKYTEILTAALGENSVYASYITAKPGYLTDIKLASLLHDIGKTAISKAVLTKPSKLTAEEFEEIKQHTVIAGEVLLKANRTFLETFNKDSYLALAHDIATHHHERWDGKGYPKALKGDEIPLSARIIALVDVYDALRTQRPYKEAWSHEDTMAEIVRERAKQFDPDIVDTFVTISERFRTVNSGPECEGKQVKGAALCIDHLYATGARE